MRLGDLRPATVSLQAAGLVAGTTTTYTTASATVCVINGIFATALAAGTNTASPTTDWNGDAFTALAADRGAVFVYCVVAAGTVAIVQGPTEVIDGDTDNFLIYPSFPPIDDTLCPFAYVVVKSTGASSAWTIGTSNWTATGITDSYSDIFTLPDRPVIA